MQRMNLLHIRPINVYDDLTSTQTIVDDDNLVQTNVFPMKVQGDP